MVSNVLVADLLKLFILFYMTCQPSERCPCLFVGVYMAPKPSDEFLLIGGQFFLISLAYGIGPLVSLYSLDHSMESLNLVYSK